MSDTHTSKPVEMPFVSVVISSYNSALYIDQCIQSLLAQTYPHFEIIVVDCSSDDTFHLINSCGDPRIRAFRINERISPAQARNFAIEQSTGTYIALMDSDDYCDPNRLEAQLAHLARTGAWSAHAAGWCLNRLTGIRWIAEIHDPLVERQQTQFPTLLKAYSREALTRRLLEKSICEQADLCWWFTKGALRHASYRNPSIKGPGFFLLPGAQEPRIRVNYRSSEQLIIGHFGSLSQSRSLSDVIDALAEFLSSFPARRGYVKVHVYGSTLDKQSIKAIERNKVADSVVEHGRVEADRTTGLSGRQRINMMMQTCDYLLLLHGSDPSCSEYIPSKFYEYWWAGRPVLALVHKNLQLESLALSMSDQNRVYRAADERKAGTKMLIDAWDRWQDGTISKFELKTSPISPRDAVAKVNEELNRKIKYA